MWIVDIFNLNIFDLSQVQDKEYKYIMTIVIVAVIALIVLRWKSTKVSPEIQQMGDVSNLTHVDRRNSFSGCDNDKIESMGPTMQKYDSESTLGKKIIHCTKF